MTDNTSDGDVSSTSDESGVTANAEQTVQASTAMRAQIAALVSDSNFQERDIYETFDWKRRPRVEQYYALYRTHPFAGPIVDRPAFTTWRDTPAVVDDPDNETDFEQDVDRLFQNLNLDSTFERVDRLAGIGRYGLTVFVTTDALDEDGTVDADRLAQPIDPMQFTADGLDNVVQIRQFSEVSVDGIEWGTEEHAGEGRWGLPVQYSIDFASEGDRDVSQSERVWDVHHSRTVAVPAGRRLDHDFFAPPRLEGTFNILRDILKTLGSVAEMAYRGADKGLAVEYDPEKVNVTNDDFWEQNDEEMQEWNQGLKPLFESVGTVKELGGRIADVSNIFEPQLSALATDTGIPKRVFEGDPAGALASAEEDTQAYFGLIKERRTEYGDPLIATPHVQWFVDNGLIASPIGGTFGWEWDALRVLSEKEQAELEKTRFEALGQVSQDPITDFGHQVVMDYARTGDLPEDVDGVEDMVGELEADSEAAANARSVEEITANYGGDE
ncbi:anti-CBASS protein Acb1 family protein [Natrialba sp. SSL1]|uniref:anti-CBASS protein Acb1 family protein n=1 Tax=Natrialba sp. SSL1 TaxID=1869245 RepID=UPI0008F87007|nr:anti-CBASS Acb1 family protein [Natrialba sp. SSL1]OIB56611.1 hypothetical protein BBD46_16615 [Natrialba sp. SSL1]